MAGTVTEIRGDIMTVIESIRKRYSCRSYHDKPVEQAKLDEIFEAARLAPSAKNFQEGPILRTDDSVYMGFGFESIAGEETRAEVMRRVMDYFGIN